MELFYQNRAMYCKTSDVESQNVFLGDSLLCPGHKLYKLGDKKRSSFQLENGKFLRYVGLVPGHQILLFSVDDFESDFYYAFHQVDDNTLLVGSHIGCAEITVNSLDFVQDSNYVTQQ